MISKPDVWARRRVSTSSAIRASSRDSLGCRQRRVSSMGSPCKSRRPRLMLAGKYRDDRYWSCKHGLGPGADDRYSTPGFRTELTESGQRDVALACPMLPPELAALVGRDDDRNTETIAVARSSAHSMMWPRRYDATCGCICYHNRLVAPHGLNAGACSGY